MNAKPARLDQVQRWMQSVIMHSGSVAEGIASPGAREHLAVSTGELESVINASASLDAESRLEIYVDAYFERLLECLSEEFAATRRALGDELFQAIAFGYLQHYPSRSYTLHALGKDFATYLAESRLHERDAPAGATPTWGDCMIELAAFERLMHEVFDGPGSEGHPPLDHDKLARLSPDDWGSLRLMTAPSLKLRRFDHPVHAYWSALKEGIEPAVPEPRVVYLAISRRDFTVERRELSSSEFALLEQVAAGATLGDAIALASEGVDAGAVEGRLAVWFADWTRDLYVMDVVL
jgi:Putative DNA-binding domain